MSVVDRLVAWGTRQRVPWWVLVILSWVPLAIAAVVVARAQGGAGQSDAAAVAWTAFGPWGLVTYGALARLAGRAIDRFRPAIDLDDAEFAQLRTRVTTTRPWVGVALLIASAVEPTWHAVRAPGDGGLAVTVAAWLIRYLGGPTTGAFASVLLVSIAVTASHLHGRAQRIDLFHPVAAHAFALVTAFAAVTLVLVSSYRVATDPASLRAPATAAIYGATVLTAVVVFVAPLLGMRARLHAEQERLRALAHSRLAAAVTRLEAAVDAGDDEKVAAIRQSIGALRDEVDRVEGASTWPWHGRTLRALVSGLLLPVVTYVATQGVGRLLHL